MSSPETTIHKVTMLMDGNVGTAVKINGNGNPSTATSSNKEFYVLVKNDKIIEMKKEIEQLRSKEEEPNQKELTDAQMEAFMENIHSGNTSNPEEQINPGDNDMYDNIEDILDNEVEKSTESHNITIKEKIEQELMSKLQNSP